MEAAPEEARSRRKNIIYRMFSESMFMFFFIFIVFSIVLFILIGPYAPIVLVVIQFVMILFSDKVIARMGDWHITERNPNVQLLQYHLPVEEYKEFQQRYSKDVLQKMKAEIYERTLAQGKPIECETATEVFAKYGLKCTPENLSTKTVNVYEIVMKDAEIFHLPIPKIVIANTTVPNAAASGPSPSRGVVLITSGLLVQLDEEEILNVVGHEFGHLKARDPLVLFGLTSAEYMLRVYVFWPLFLLFGYLYLFFAFSLLYFIAKFFEGRADLDAAIKLGQPKVLAEALQKIGFRRLEFERRHTHNIQGWIGWDPHPPIYFRVDRLERLQNPEKIRHPLIQSIRDNMKGFLEALG